MDNQPFTMIEPAAQCPLMLLLTYREHKLQVAGGK